MARRWTEPGRTVTDERRAGKTQSILKYRCPLLAHKTWQLLSAKVKSASAQIPK
jgi:hypothetical protein